MRTQLLALACDIAGRENGNPLPAPLRRVPCPVKGKGRNLRQGKRRGAEAVLVVMTGLLALAGPVPKILAAADAATPPKPAASTPLPLAEALGIGFVDGSISQVLIHREGKTYLVDLERRTIRFLDAPLVASGGAELRSAATKPPHQSAIDNRQSAMVAAQPLPVAQDAQTGAKIFAQNCSSCHGADGKGNPAFRTPDFTSPQVQASLTDQELIRTIRDGRKGTAMPAWGGKLTAGDIAAAGAFVRSLGSGAKPPGAGGASATPQKAEVYIPADDYLLGLPTGRALDRHGVYVNFTHRFVYNPAFTGPGLGNTLMGLDGFSVSSFGFRYGFTDKLSGSVYRSPSIILRPIEFMLAYHALDEQRGAPLNLTLRVSEDGEDNFRDNFTTNFEGIISRSVKTRAQLYLVPTVSIQNRELLQTPVALNARLPGFPGVNTFSLGVGGALDIRPSVALIAEVIPTLAGGRELGIHRPAYAFGIQKRVYHHAFTFGFTTSPGTTVAQRAGTRATFLGDPTADTPSGLFIAFDLMRQLH